MNPKIRPYINSIKDKNIHIVGASGAEGAAIIQFLVNNKVNRITAHDFQENLSTFRKTFKQVHPTFTAKQRAALLKKINSPKVKLNLKENYLQDIENADLVFLTQAWYMYPPNFPKIKKIIKQGTEISSLTKLYLDLAPCYTIGITGSQGKTTTTSLISHILKKAGKKVYTAGNIRGIHKQILSNINKIKKNDIIVLEISNRQLSIDLQKSPNTAVITTISPNHIEEHGSYQKYKDIKKSILKHQQKPDIAVLNYDNPITRKYKEATKAKTIYFSNKTEITEGVYQKNKVIYSLNKPLIKTNAIPLKGEHNISNILAAIAATTNFNIKPEIYQKAIKTFKGIAHRLQKIAEINGAEYYDDLKSTTPTATITAIKSFPNKKIHLIVGGHHKNTPYTKLAKNINQKVDTLYTLPGTATELLLNELKKIKSKITIYQFEDIFTLTKKAQQLAKPGEIVLMSPAGAYFQREHLKNKYSFAKILKH